MRRLTRILVGALLAAQIAGCWNRREVNDVAIVSAAAIDRTASGRIRLTIQITKPESPSGGPEAAGRPTKVFVLGAEGGTLIEALRSVNHELPRPLGWEHNNVIVIGEEVARQGIADVLDFFMRNYQSRLDQWLLIAAGEAAPVLKGNFFLELNPGLAMRKIQKNASIATGEAAPVRLHEFLLGLYNLPSAPLAASIEPVGSGEESESGSPRYRIGGAAVFVHDRMVGRLTDHQLRGIQWLQGKVRHAVIRLPCQKTEGNGISVEILQTQAKMAAQWQEGPLPVVRISLLVTARLGGQMCRDDLSSPEALDMLAVRTGREITSEAQEAVRIVQEKFGADPVGVGRAIERAFPARWPALFSRWRTVYPEIRVQPEVTVRITQTGTSVGKPLPRSQNQ